MLKHYIDTALRNLGKGRALTLINMPGLSFG